MSTPRAFGKSKKAGPVFINTDPAVDVTDNRDPDKDAKAVRESLEKMFKNISQDMQPHSNNQSAETPKESQMEKPTSPLHKEGPVVDAVDKNETNTVEPPLPPSEPPHGGGGGGGGGSYDGDKDEENRFAEEANTNASSAKKLAFVAIAIAVLALILALLLFGSKVGHTEFNELQVVVTEQGKTVDKLATFSDKAEETLSAIFKDLGSVKSTSTTALATANEAKAKSAKALFEAGVAKKSAAAARAKADKALKGINTLQKQGITQPLKPISQELKAVSQGVSPSVVVSPPQTGAIFLWHPNDATESAPKACIISAGEGLGLPPYCNGFKVVPANAGETKNDWLLRVGGGGRAENTGSYQRKN